MTVHAPATRDAMAALRRFAQPRPTVERCALCGAELPPTHLHLWDTSARRPACSCTACSVLFPADANARFRRIPGRVEFLADFRLADGHWDSLGVPVGIAFFVRRAGGVVAAYPGAAGAVESPVAADAWGALEADNPILAHFKPETEALLVNRVGTERAHYRAPVDECFRLAGLIRAKWRGFAGGAEAWAEIGSFFAGLRERSRA